MSVPKTKAQLNTLIEGYIADGSPNIRASEHKEIELAILDRVDARILHVGTFTHTDPQSRQGNWNQPVTFGKTLYTSNYLVSITPFSLPYPQITPKISALSVRTSTAVTNKQKTGFTALLKRNEDWGPGRFIYVVVNLANDI